MDDTSLLVASLSKMLVLHKEIPYRARNVLWDMNDPDLQVERHFWRSPSQCLF